jgi:hypothetical protein
MLQLTSRVTGGTGWQVDGGRRGHGPLHQLSSTSVKYGECVTTDSVADQRESAWYGEGRRRAALQTERRRLAAVWTRAGHDSRKKNSSTLLTRYNQPRGRPRFPESPLHPEDGYSFKENSRREQQIWCLGPTCRVIRILVYLSPFPFAGLRKGNPVERRSLIDQLIIISYYSKPTRCWLLY